MSTKRIWELLKWARAQDADTVTFDGTSIGPPVLSEVEAEIEAIEKGARHLVAWNGKGRPAFDIDAARGYDVLERIAKESGK